MAIHVLDSIGKLASRFVHELLPVALASVVGTLVVNHYARQPASPSVVVQAQPSASEDAIAQSLREEHELIASFVKRSQDRDDGDQRSDDLGAQAAPIAFSLADPPIPRAPTGGGAEDGRAARAKSRGQEKARPDGGASA